MTNKPHYNTMIKNHVSPRAVVFCSIAFPRGDMQDRPVQSQEIRAGLFTFCKIYGIIILESYLIDKLEFDEGYVQ